MPRYQYMARPANGGEAREIVIEAENTTEALGKLRSCAMIPVRFIGEEGAEPSGFALFGKKRADGYEFTSQLAPLLAANIPLERALAIINESSTDEAMKELAISLRQGLHEGKKFSDLIRSCGNTFPGFYANLIETGEETGCLPEVTEELQRFMGESKELKDFIVSSSIYPAVVLGITLIVVVVMFTVFVPRFAVIFSEMGREQPPSMQFLMFMSDFLKYFCLIAVVGFIGGWFGSIAYFGKKAVYQWRSNLFTRLPVFGKILIEIEIGRFVRTLAILISNHVDIIKTVRISEKVIQNMVIRDSFNVLEPRLRGGEKLSAAFNGNPYLPPGLSSKIRVGEESGEVGPMLARSAEHLEEGTRRKIKRLLSLFEPIVIVFLALMVLVVVVSIFMAIMDINQVG